MAWAVRRPLAALLSWLLLIVGLGVAAASLGGTPDDSFALPGVQSTTAQDLLERTGVESDANPSGKVVWSPRSGTASDATNRAAADALLQQIAAEEFVLCVTGPFQQNYGRSCPGAAPNDYAAALDDAVASEVARALKIPKDHVAPVVALLEKLAPIARSDPHQLAAIARDLPFIARLASAPQSTLDALAAITPEQLRFLVGITEQDVTELTTALGDLAAFAALPPATLTALAHADPASLAAAARKLPSTVAGVEALWSDLQKALKKDPQLGPAIVAVAKKYGISTAQLTELVALVDDIAPLADANPAQLAALARDLPWLARLARADGATLEALGRITPADLHVLVGWTEADVAGITEGFGSLARFGELPADVKAAIAAANPATLARFARALPHDVAVLERDLARAKAGLAALEKAATATQQALSPVSADGTVAYATVTFDGEAIPTSLLGNRVGDVLDLVERANENGVLTVGASGQTFDNGPAEPDDSVGTGLLAALVVLLVAFGSLVAAGLPLVVSITGLAGGLMALAVAERFLPIASFTPSLAVMIGLGVGTDYALFVMSRFTQSVREGVEPREAVLLSVRTAGRAVAFAGSTVIVALLGMFVLRIDFFNGLAVGAGLTVLMVMLSALWMLPALLSLLRGRALAVRMPWARHPRPVDPESSRWARYGSLLQRKPIVLVVLALLVVLGLAAPALRMEQGFPDDGSAAAGSPVRIGYDLLAEGFGPGVNGPFFVAVQTDDPTDVAALGTVVEALEATPGVASTLPSSAMLPLVELNPKLFTDGVTSVLVQPTTGPADEETADLLDRIRGATTEQVQDSTDARIYVGGQQAVATDFTTVLAGALPLFLLVVIGFGFLALMILFHSLLIPLTAAVTSLLSFAASLGVTVAVFQLGTGDGLLDVAGTGPILPFLPIMVFAILFGLSMDYQVFLVSRMKETWDATHDPRDAVRLGLAGSGQVVVAAATIMASVFLAFVTASNATIKMFGVALAAAVLVDAFVVRLVLVPSLMSLCGRASWWMPGWLSRILPTITLEAEPSGAPVPTEAATDPEPEPAPV